MINSIDKLENLGIYRNFNRKKCSDFKQYNLIYGWNGSGKSTLSRLFAHIGGQKQLEDFHDLKVSIHYNDKSYNEKNFPLNNENILVFNDDFIKDNIDWNGTINSILLIDENNINDTKTFQSLTNYLYGTKDNDGKIIKYGAIEELERKQIELKKSEDEINKILTIAAKNIKDSFKLIAPSNTYYQGYNRKRLNDLVINKQSPLSNEDVLGEENLKSLIQQAKPQKMNEVEIIHFEINIDQCNEILTKVKDLLERKVVAQVIEELKNNQSLSLWVKEGLYLYKASGKDLCPFCGKSVDNERIDELENHFNDSLNSMLDEIDDLIKLIQKIDEGLNYTYIDISKVYDEFQDELRTTINECKMVEKKIHDHINHIENLLLEKKNNPFKKFDYSINENELNADVNQFNSIFNKYGSLIEQHNTKSQSFDKIIQTCLKKIERHYAQEQLQLHEFDAKCNALRVVKDNIEHMSLEVADKRKQYSELEAKLSNETLGAESFNEKLYSFLGYDEIKLQFDKEEKGYKILRNSVEEAHHLSEGEKTAIAFIYFMIKIKESGKKVEDCIIVLDDPISSFDSNKLFSSYAFTKSECDSAKQLFILTHNYNYFSLVLGWFNKKKIKESTSNKKIPNFAIYRVNNYIDEGHRVASLEDGGESLKQATEYDYVFANVYKMKDTILTKQEYIYCGNICRKLLESFLSFKFPKQRANIEALLEKAWPGKENDIIRERVYKFVNIYSHTKKINVFEELDSDIIDSNTTSIINDILDMIHRVDSEHYEAMVDKVQNDI